MLNTRIPKPIQDVPTVAPVHAPWRASAVLWKLQAYGLLGITFLSFFPRLFHSQEYAFFFLLAVALCLAWAERINPWIRTPIDLPLLGFVGWVLCTVPFAADPAYSFSEWRKLVAQVLVFYWAMFVLRSYRRIELSRQIFWAVVLGSLVLSGFALVDFVLRGGTWRDRLIRAEAPYSDYNWLATYLVLVIPILIGWIVIHRTFWVRAIGTLTLVMAGFAQVATYSRAGWGSAFNTGSRFRAYGWTTPTRYVGSCGRDRDGGRLARRLRDWIPTGYRRFLDHQHPCENMGTRVSSSGSASPRRGRVRE